LITRRYRTWLLAVLLLITAGSLAGCLSGGGRAATLTGASWPGIATSDNLIYLAFGPQVRAIDPETGTQTWAYPTEPNSRRTFYAQPAVGDEAIFVTDYEQTLSALDPETGAEIWSFGSDRSRFIGGAALGEAHVYAGTVDGTLFALDRGNGQEVWTFEADRDIWSTPLVVGDIVYVTTLDRHLYALDTASGGLLWKFPQDIDAVDPRMGAIVGTPTQFDDALVFGSFNNHVYAVNSQTQDVLWTYPTTNWVWNGPVYDEEDGLLIGGDLDGQVFALNAETGETAWTFDEAGGPVVGRPALGETSNGRVVYVASGGTGSQAKLYILDPATGERVDTPVTIEAEFTSRFLVFPTGTSIRPIPIYASPVVYGDLLLIGAHEGDYPLYALDRETLLERWHFEPPSS
jgi:outer membrane protein assembly factor BamB